MRRLIGSKVFERLLQEDFEFYGMKELRISKTLAEEHYKIHKGKPFYPWLIDFITAGPIIPVIIQGEKSITRVRLLLGTTLVQEADPDSLRGRYGIWGGINIAHASDSVTSAESEIALWVKNADLTIEQNSRKTLQTYCTKWGMIHNDYTSDLRKICKRLTEVSDKEDYEKAQTLINAYLEKECLGFTTEQIENLSHLIVEHIVRKKG